MNKKLGILSIAVAAIVALTGCGSTRQIDPADTNSWQIPGTSWYGFCDGRNAFIWIPSKSDTSPDELEAVIYDHWRCIKDINPGVTPNSSSKPDTDPDGIFDDEDD